VKGALDAKGWCLVQMVASDEDCREAVREAEKFPKFKPLKKELVTDYLGRGGTGKTAFLDPKEPGKDNRYYPGALAAFDGALAEFAEICAPASWDMMGFHHGDRTRGMLWMPYANAKEEGALKPEPLDDDDIDEGKVADHIRFLQHRKLCLQAWLNNSGGHVTLIPAPDSNGEPVELPLTTKKLLVLRSERFTFQYSPAPDVVPGNTSLVLQAWMVEDIPEMQMVKIEGDVQSKSWAMGITVGRPMPEGDRQHIMSVMARLPGGGFGPEEYWAMLLEGTDGMVMIPSLRWDTDLYCTKEDEPHMPGKAYAHHGGFCRHHEIFSFDHEFFDLSVEEAKYMSPSQRIFAEDGYSVLYRGGHTKESIKGQPIGVFLGDTGSDWAPYQYVEHQLEHQGQTHSVYGFHADSLMGWKNEVTCSRLSYMMNMKGPISTADTACSSSLYATGIAMTYMRPRAAGMETTVEDRCYEGVMGGVCTQIGPGSYIGMCGLNMISPVGRCFTFDESGDGYARGEGVGLMYLKGSEDEEDTYKQLSCITGCAINQDGRSASMTAPNGPSQQACIMQSMREAGNEARDINLAECHGTGTALGDPIEVGALRNAMEPRDNALALTSSKSNIGHLEGGAGIAGLLKCILMLMAGTCPPNAHCRQLNPHLAVSGFPCYFDTEGIDTNLNAALTGVSSFGFGGTNGRCDIWGQARFGVRFSGKLNLEELDQMTVTCPVTMGPIDHITGEPMTKPTGDRTKVRANVLRDEFASYDVSRHAYAGGFRYRQSEVPDEDEGELDGDSQVYICGSWSGYTEMEEMDHEGGGWYSATVILGEGRYEMFNLCLNKSKALQIYPAVDKASQKIWVQGVDELGDGKRWIIDGRDMEVPAGTVYKIHFKYGNTRMLVNWEEETSKESVDLALKYEHSYYVSGTFSKWRHVALAAEAGAEGTWEGSFRIGSQGKEEFQFVRDKDPQQAIYPSQHKAAKPGVPVRGPDDLGSGKNFVVRGRPGEDVQVKLTVVDAKITVAVSTETKGQKEWTSLEGWERHAYFVTGSFDAGAPVPMSMDVMKPGIFTCRTTVGTTWSDACSGFVGSFQVTVDEGAQNAFYPEMDGAISGEMIVRGPDSSGADKFFLVRVPEPDAEIEISLDLNAEDKRNIVTWMPTQSALMN